MLHISIYMLYFLSIFTSVFPCIYIWDSIFFSLPVTCVDVWNVGSINTGRQQMRYEWLKTTKNFGALFFQLQSIIIRDKLESCSALLWLRKGYSVLYSLYDYQNNSEAFSSRYKLDATTIKSVKQVARSSNNSAMRREVLPWEICLSFAVSFRSSWVVRWSYGQAQSQRVRVSK